MDDLNILEPKVQALSGSEITKRITAATEQVFVRRAMFDNAPKAEFKTRELSPRLLPDETTPKANTGAGLKVSTDPAGDTPSIKPEPEIEKPASTCAEPIARKLAKEAVKPVGTPVTMFTQEEVEKKLADARKQAYSDGLDEGRSEAEGSLGDAKKALESATVALLRPEAGQSRTLNASLRKAVLSLASQRAGLTIDDAPDEFLGRIQMLAERATQNIGKAKIALNPEDLEAVIPHLTQISDLSEAQFTADPDLVRGDAEIRTDDIFLADILNAPVQDAPRHAAE